MTVKPAILVHRSQNRKLSTDNKVNATYVSQATCPSTCPFKNSGCYAEFGDMLYATRRLNAAKQQNPTRVARIEAALIKNSTARFPLRLHVVGDCANRKSAAILAEASAEYSSKHNQIVWTYTHNRTIPREFWGNISVLRSCSTIRQAETAINAGFAAALIVPKFKSEKRYYLGRGLYGIPCPKQTHKSASCVDCKLCFKDMALKDRKNVILFAAHGNAKAKVIDYLEEVNGKHGED